jgi:hypothetical protein
VGLGGGQQVVQLKELMCLDSPQAINGIGEVGDPVSPIAPRAVFADDHHGGGVGMGYSLHAGMVIVADGTKEAEQRLERVLTTDPGMGVVRHADAGYELAKKTAKEKGIHIQMLK